MNQLYKNKTPLINIELYFQLFFKLTNSLKNV